MIQKKQSMGALIAVQLGGALCVPLIDAGFAMGMRIGFLPALAIIILVNTGGAFLGMLSALFGAQYQLNTAQAAEKFLGPVGGSFVALSFFCAGTGWYAIHSATAVGRIARFLPAVPFSLLILGASILILAVAWRGIASIGMLAQCAIPFYLVVMGLLFYQAPSLIPFPQEQSGAFLSVAALSAALLIGAVANFPTFFRVAKTTYDARWGGFLVPLVVLLPIESVGAYLGAAYGGGSLLEQVTQGSTPGWITLLMVFVILSSWTALNNALYSGGVSFAALSPKISEQVGFLVVAVCGSLIALSVPASAFCLIIELIGVPLVPIGALVVYYMLSQWYSWIPQLSRGQCQIVVLLSSLVTILGYTAYLPITGEPFIDGALATGVALCLVGKMPTLW
jgi:purine-cytosine permease-like protein